MANAIDLLVAAGALRRSDETLTALGAHLVSLPVAPRSGRCWWSPRRSGTRAALTVAAATATRGFFILPPDAKRAADASRRAFAGDAASDHVATARAFEEWRSVFAKARGARRARLPRALLSRDALERVAEVREQLRSLLRTAGFARREPSAGSAASSSALDVEVFQPWRARLVPKNRRRVQTGAASS